MQIPVQVSFHGTPVSDEVEALCRDEVEKLERYFDRTTGCRITIEQTNHHHRQGEHWRVRIHLTLPGGEIDVNRDPPGHAADEKLELALREAFDRARRKVQDHARKVSGQVKRHETPGEG